MTDRPGGRPVFEARFVDRIDQDPHDPQPRRVLHPGELDDGVMLVTVRNARAGAPRR